MFAGNPDADVSYAFALLRHPVSNLRSQKLCTHAVDQFEPEGDEAHYDDSLSGVGSHDNEMFNLEAWKARLKPANEAVRQRMYYV